MERTANLYTSLLVKSAKSVTEDRAMGYLEIMMYCPICTSPQSKTISLLTKFFNLINKSEDERQVCDKLFSLPSASSKFPHKKIHPTNKLHNDDSGD